MLHCFPLFIRWLLARRFCQSRSILPSSEFLKLRARLGAGTENDAASRQHCRKKATFPAAASGRILPLLPFSFYNIACFRNFCLTAAQRFQQCFHGGSLFCGASCCFPGSRTFAQSVAAFLPLLLLSVFSSRAPAHAGSGPAPTTAMQNSSEHNPILVPSTPVALIPYRGWQHTTIRRRAPRYKSSIEFLSVLLCLALLPFFTISGMYLPAESLPGALFPALVLRFRFLIKTSSYL